MFLWYCRLRAHRTVTPMICAVMAVVALILSSCSATDSSALGTTKVSVALDFIANNASYVGFYVAQKKGFYADAKIDAQINGYTSTSPDVLVGSGQAQFGTIDQATIIMDRAANQNLIAVAALMQHDAQRFAIAPAKSKELTRPRDLDGHVYGGFGLPLEAAINAAAIHLDGGAGNYQNVVLGTDAYTALSDNKVDWSVIYETDDILWAQMDGRPFGTIDYRKYGIPDMYAKLLFGSADFLSAQPDVARAFVDATIRGYEWAAAHPDEAVDIMQSLNVGPLDLDKQKATARALAKDYWLDANGRVGSMDAKRWTDYATFLTHAGVLKDAAGNTLTEVPDVSADFDLTYVK